MKSACALLFLSISAGAIADCTKPDQSFEDFFAKFSESKNFALDRTIYPTYTLRAIPNLEYGDITVIKVMTTISRKDDLPSPTINAILLQNGMNSEIHAMHHDNVVVKIFKPATDWLLTYEFTKKHGCWYLHHIEDHSL